MPKPIPLEMDFPESSAVVRGRYRPETRELVLWWRAGEEDRVGRGYGYFPVPREEWAALLKVHESGRSVGEYANRRIKERYEYRPLDDEDPPPNRPGSAGLNLHGRYRRRRRRARRD